MALFAAFEVFRTPSFFTSLLETSQQKNALKGSIHTCVHVPSPHHPRLSALSRPVSEPEKKVAGRLANMMV